MVGEGVTPLLHEIFGQPARVGAKSPIFNRYSRRSGPDVVSQSPDGRRRC